MCEVSLQKGFPYSGRMCRCASFSFIESYFGKHIPYRVFYILYRFTLLYIKISNSIYTALHTDIEQVSTWLYTKIKYSIDINRALLRIPF